MASGAVEWMTLVHHSHNADGTERAEHCCGCFNIRPDLVAYCNECGEEWDVGSWLSPGVRETRHVPLTGDRA